MNNKKNTIPERSELPVKSTWDLNPLYSNKKEWENDFEKIDAMLKEVLKFKRKLKLSAANISEAYDASDKMDRLLEKLYVYAHLKSDEDTGDSENRARMDVISAKLADIEGEIAWFEPELMAIPEKKLREFLETKELAFYRKSIEELLRYRKHTLSAKEERVLGKASDIFGTAHKTFSVLNDADLKFPQVKDETGKEADLTHGSYRKFLESEKRDVRKAAFEAIYDTYKTFRNTFASTLNGTVKMHAFNAEIRKYPSAIEGSLFHDNVPLDIYTSLISSVRNNLPALHKYFAVRAKAMKLDKINMYDIFNPLIPDTRIEVSWEEACEWVRNALKPMGQEYCAIMEKAFADRWIDVLECKGKRSGAYSSGCYDSPPYVLLNFYGTLNDVFTLAHELGHSMHSHYSNNHQQYHYADYSIFVAEVASTTNELLLYNYLMKTKTDPKFRLYLINHLADEVRGTVYRQTMFAEFEKIIHDNVENDIPLTPDSLSEIYLKLNTEYHGDSMDADKRIEMEWARIPHFYYNFYVYKYATGFSAAAMLSKNILSGDPKKLEAYMGFLKAGDSKDVLDIMLDAGVDLRGPEPVNTALREFAEAVDELEKGLKLN